MFLLLCAGNILSSSVSGPLSNEVREVVNPGSIPLQTIVRASLLLLPALLALLLSRKSVKKKKMPLHIIAAVAAGVLAYLWFIRTLPFEEFSKLESIDATVQLMRIRDMALIAGILSTLGLILVERPKPEEDGKKHKKKH